MTFAGWVATVAGWYVTEIGRQPWLVQGVLRVADAASDVPAPMIGLSLSMYLAVYAVLLAAFIQTIFHMAGKAAKTAGAAPPAAGGTRPGYMPAE
jgi:cytochrome bd ubiquinol oxidase subunit I